MELFKSEMLEGPRELLDLSAVASVVGGGGFKFLVEVLGSSEAGFIPERREISFLTDVTLQVVEHALAEVQDLHGC